MQQPSADVFPPMLLMAAAVEASAGAETSMHVATIVADVEISTTPVVGSTTVHPNSANTTIVLSTTLDMPRLALTRASLFHQPFQGLASSSQDFHDSQGFD
jgi:hypothetical protein